MSTAEIVKLDDFELQIVRLCSIGYQYKEIAQKLQRSETNVKWHAMRAKDKLGAKTIAHAVAIAIRKGML